jgi:hypothetical protein
LTLSSRPFEYAFSPPRGPVEGAQHVDAAAAVAGRGRADQPAEGRRVKRADAPRDERRHDLLGSRDDVRERDRANHRRLRATGSLHEAHRRIEVASERMQVAQQALPLQVPAAAQSSPAFRSAPPVPNRTMSALRTVVRVNPSKRSAATSSELL